MKTKHYHNTNGLDRLNAKLQAGKNFNQEDLIYNIFQRSTFKSLTASEVWKHFKVIKNVPLTSIRRGISNLQTEGYLLKMDKTQTGIYGKPEHHYRILQTKI